jgi:hypothetical protein
MAASVLRLGCLAFTALFSLAGCGGADQAKPDSLQQVLESFEGALVDASAELQATSGQEGGGQHGDTMMMTERILAMAQELATSATGSPVETDAKAILANAEELRQKAESGMKPSEVSQHVQQLLQTARGAKGKL